MSQDYHHSNILTFSNGFERSSASASSVSQHLQQIRREKPRPLAGFDPSPPPLVGIDEEESSSSAGLHVFESAGMLSEMFNFPLGSTAARPHPPPGEGITNDWYGNSRYDQISEMNANTAAAMHLFVSNPNPKSPSPAPPTNSSTLHTLLPNYPSNYSLQLQGHFGQFTCNPTEIGTIVENHRGLSLSLSSSLHDQLEVAKQLRMGGENGNFMCFNNQGGSSSGVGSSIQYLYRNSNQYSLGAVNVIRNSKYVRAAQELLDEFCSVGKCQFKKTQFGRRNLNPSGGDGGSSSSSKDQSSPNSSAADRVEHQRRKVKLMSMLDEVDRRYQNYCEQMQMVVNSFDLVMGYGAAGPYTTLTQKAMSRHFRCLKDAISTQLKRSCEVLGEKDGVGNSGLTKGETPRLKMLEQSLRQQRAFHQMGMMEQEAWRPQRGLPERSVNVLRAWLFEHFLHPYPSDADKHLLARQTGLSRNQVSNWFINARVRLWKPMVEEMYQQESKEEEEDGPSPSDEEERERNHNTNFSQTPTTPTGIRSHIFATESDLSLLAINRQVFSENQAKHSTITTTTATTTGIEVAPQQISQCFPPTHESENLHDSFPRGRIVGVDYNGTTPANDEMGSTLISFGTTPGDVSLTLGLRHAGNLPEKSSFSLRDFGGY